MCQGTRRDHEDRAGRNMQVSQYENPSIQRQREEAEKEEKFLEIVSGMMGLNTVSMEIKE